MNTHNTRTARSQSFCHPQFMPSDQKRLMLAVRLRMLQAQLRNGRNIRPSDLTLLIPYCEDSSDPSVGS
jgi:hypothetical protein